MSLLDVSRVANSDALAGSGTRSMGSGNDVGYGFSVDTALHQVGGEAAAAGCRESERARGQAQRSGRPRALRPRPWAGARRRGASGSSRAVLAP